jgi:hypothetical protein
MKYFSVPFMVFLLFTLQIPYAAAQEFDYGDAPEGVIAYPFNGVMGMFPTCMNVGPAGFIQHGWGVPPWVFFGPIADIESEGNAGNCPAFLYDMDECVADGDAGLIIPTAYTIDTLMNIVPCPNATQPFLSLGAVCTTAIWGVNVDIIVQETYGLDAFVNVIIDWDQSGSWGGQSTCPGGQNAPEHVLINFLIPAGFSGPLSVLGPPPFLIGPMPDFVWARFTVTYQAVAVPWDGSGIFEDGESEDYLLQINPSSQPTNTPTPLPTDTPTPSPTPTGPIEVYDFGDAPENALAYPSTGILGMFPTCKNSGPAGWIEHWFGMAFFGPSWDAESDGNAGNCPVFANLYDQDECMNDPDAGLMFPDSFTIVGPTGSEFVAPCPGAAGMPLGFPCQFAQWGQNIDIHIQNMMSMTVFINVLMDWDQNGMWGGASICPGGMNAPEYILVDFPVPGNFSGPLSALMPPSFLIGPNGGFIWTRFSITGIPINIPDWDGSGIFEIGETEDYLLYIDQEVTPTPTFTPFPTFTPIPTDTPTPTSTFTPTPTHTPIPTNTPTFTPTHTPTFTPTHTPTNTPTLTPTNTPTNTPTITPTDTPECLNTGDVNDDGVITAGDAQLAFMIALGAYSPTYKEWCAADCNGDGVVTAGDAQLIFLAALGSGACVDPLP